MKYFKKLAEGIDVEPLRLQIEARPDLWNVNKARLSDDDAHPFAGTSDQWLRYRALEELTSKQAFREPHWSVNYPSWHALPAAQDIIFNLMHMVRAVHLGGVLLTKIPAGGRVKPHDDRGSWHAEQMDCKVYIPIIANDKCVNYCGDESVVMKAGDCWEFDNQVIHSVENNGPTDRWTLISCMRL